MSLELSELMEKQYLKVPRRLWEFVLGCKVRELHHFLLAQ